MNNIIPIDYEYKKQRQAVCEIRQDDKHLHNIEAEIMLLGYLFCNPDYVYKACSILEERHFFDGEHKKIYKKILEITSKNKPLEINLIHKSLDGVEKSYLDSLQEQANIIGGRSDFGQKMADGYLNALVSMGNKRRLWCLLKLSTLDFEKFEDWQIFDQVKNKLMDELYKFDSKIDDKNDSKPIYEYNQEFLKAYEDRCNNGDQLNGISTGFKGLDDYLGGMASGHSIIIAGRPAMGKTTFALNLCRNVCDMGKRVLFISLEMEMPDVLGRFYSNVCRISNDKIKKGTASISEREQVISKANDVESRKYGFIINTKCRMNMNDIRSCCHLHQKTGGIDLVVIDYMGKIDRPRDRDNSNTQIGKISNEICMLAKELQVPFITLSQLNRAVEATDDKRPMLSHLRDSGDVEQDADAVLFLYREDYYLAKERRKRKKDEDERIKRLGEVEGTAEVIIAKNRHGSTGTVYFDFEGQFFNFNEKVVL